LNHTEFSKDEISNFHQRIGKNIKKIRKSKQVTQLDLALTIGHKSMSTIGKIEAGLENKHYNIEQLYKIAKVLNVDICDFFQDEREDYIICSIYFLILVKIYNLRQAYKLSYYKGIELFMMTTYKYI